MAFQPAAFLSADGKRHRRLRFQLDAVFSDWRKEKEKKKATVMENWNDHICPLGAGHLSLFTQSYWAAIIYIKTLSPLLTVDLVTLV